MQQGHIFQQQGKHVPVMEEGLVVMYQVVHVKSGEEEFSVMDLPCGVNQSYLALMKEKILVLFTV